MVRLINPLNWNKVLFPANETSDTEKRQRKGRGEQKSLTSSRTDMSSRRLRSRLIQDSAYETSGLDFSSASEFSNWACVSRRGRERERERRSGKGKK
jgi:hypothetical protein